jgi:photosystem I P700 chlorophyll a apoprotein A1
MPRFHTNALYNAPCCMEFWYKTGRAGAQLGKMCTSTTWLWNLHADSHDFMLTTDLSSRNKQVLAANLWHVSLVCFWMLGMHFHGVYFSNFWQWCEDPVGISPASIGVYAVVGQELLNCTTNGDYFTGLRVTSAFMHLWYSLGALHASSILALSVAVSCLCGVFIFSAYLCIHVHPGFPALRFHTGSHICYILGCASLAFAGHQVHVATPLQWLQALGNVPYAIPTPYAVALQSHDVSASMGLGWAYYIPAAEHMGLFQYTQTVSPAQLAAHHAYVGCSAIVISLWLSTFSEQTSHRHRVHLRPTAHHFAAQSQA